ncbi:hypothetical protein V5799_027659 [Amblyomma americanum]|uniref:Uncharacterized protein n=1 Tax=Amblyomma americanum TaxID=6943 RepID=A0AAQ4DF31_AMBAM
MAMHFRFIVSTSPALHKSPRHRHGLQWAWQHGRDDIASPYAVVCAATGPGLLFLRSRQPDYRRRTCARCLPAGRCGWTVAIPP